MICLFLLLSSVEQDVLSFKSFSEGIVIKSHASVYDINIYSLAIGRFYY